MTRAVLHGRQGDAEKAAADVTAALAIEDNPTAVLQAACAFAQISTAHTQHRDQALQLLARALGAQPALAGIAVTDPDLAPIRDSEQFDRIIDAAEVMGRSGAADEQETTAAR
jgi:hypothetical protein